MRTITFLGAAGTVTGSCFLISENNRPLVLIDCGMFQGASDIEAYNRDSFPFDVGELEAVILTHAHLDHCGRLPYLLGQGFNGKLYTSAATLNLITLSLYNSAKITRIEDGDFALFDRGDVEKTLTSVVTVDYGEDFRVSNFSCRFSDAGHILGAASVVLTDNNGRKFVFSGDLGNTPQDIIKPTEYIKNGNIVIMESTYGDRNHPQEDIYQLLQEEINAVEKTRGTLLIPSFAVERTQDLLYIIKSLKQASRILTKTPVYLDSPLAIGATRVYRKYPLLFNPKFLESAKREDPFNFPYLEYVEKPKISREIRNKPGPKVIIAGSGMMDGGRIVRHAADYLEKQSTRLLFVGYQADDTLGREIKDGARKVYIDDRGVTIRATVSEISGLSAHADQRKLLEWLSHINGAERVFLVHGDDEARVALKTKIGEKYNGILIDLPQHNEDFSL